MSLLLDPLAQQVDDTLSPSDRPTERQLWAAVALLVLPAPLVAFVRWRTR